VPVFPVAVPGAALSPGKSNCSFENAPALVVTGGLVFEVLVPSLISLVVTVKEPAVFKVIVNDLEPAISAALAGRPAFPSLEVMPQVCVLLTMFQEASTALTVTEKGLPAICEFGVPFFPETVPGAAVSPGSKSCS
jgi:hypothetical protein